MKRKKKGNYERCWRYLKESRNYFLAASMLLVFSALIGFLFPVFLIDVIRKFIEEILSRTSDLSFFELFLFIFKNNLSTAFFGLFLGVFFGFFPVMLVILNGYVLGFVINLSVGTSGIASLWRLFPHGIFEIPALILSLGLGLKLGMFVFAKAGKRKKVLAYNLKNSLRVFVFVILPLLLIAGIIEAWLIIFLG